MQGGTEILECLGYTEYTGFALKQPLSPAVSAPRLGALAAELALAAVEISSLLVRVPPTLEAMALIQRQAEPFPGGEPEGNFFVFYRFLSHA